MGIGAPMMPAMAAANTTLSRAEVPRATSALKVINRIGGSLGAVILAVAGRKGTGHEILEPDGLRPGSPAPAPGQGSR